MVETKSWNRWRESIVALQDDRGEQLMIELQARDAWNQRDFVRAQELAERGADLAVACNDEAAWWNATFLVSEALRKQGRMQDSLETAATLEEHPLTHASIALSARVATLKSFALQGTGALGPAVAAARTAVQLAGDEPGQKSIRMEAQNALIASLADSDQLDGAWQESQVLADLLATEPPTQTTGLGYWAIGNVAFLLKHIDEAVAYHRLAAEHLSPSNDLALWARFNRASAALRLTAAVTGPETLECIERAELASSIVGGSERDRLELKLTRAQWLVLTGQYDLAVDQLASIIERQHLLASHTAAQAHFLLGEALLSNREVEPAREHLTISEGLFLQSGAEDRAATARGLLQGMDAALG